MLNVKGGNNMGLQQTLKALADPTRREILNLLKNGKRSAGEIAEQFDITAAAVSRHLSVLKEADLIEDTRDGKFIFYELNASVLEEILLWISDLKGEDIHEKPVCRMYHFYVYRQPDSATGIPGGLRPSAQKAGDLERMAAGRTGIYRTSDSDSNSDSDRPVPD